MLKGLAVLHHTFADRLALAYGGRQTTDEIARCATRLLALYQGVLVLVRAGYPTLDVEPMITATFDELKETSHVN